MPPDEVTLSMNLLQNPFPLYRLERPGPQQPVERTLVGWQWRDEHGNIMEGVYPTQLSALRAILDYADKMERGPTWRGPTWRSLWAKIRGFWYAV